jgi:hypothetical protein
MAAAVVSLEIRIAQHASSDLCVRASAWQRRSAREFAEAGEE